jgi:hypothetical protein
MALNLFADVTGLTEYQVPEIAPGFWIRVRNDLSVGEHKAIFAKAFRGQVDLPNNQVRNEYDMVEVSMGQVCAYMVEWSEKVPCTPDAIRALKRDYYNAIEDIVQKHVKALEKKDPPTMNQPVISKANQSESQNSESANVLVGN